MSDSSASVPKLRVLESLTPANQQVSMAGGSQLQSSHQSFRKVKLKVFLCVALCKA